MKPYLGYHVMTYPFRIYSILALCAGVLFVQTWTLKAGTKYVNPKNAASISSSAAGANPGDVIIVRSGEYFGNVFITRSGTKEKPITIKSEVPLGAIIRPTNPKKGTVNISGDYVIFEGFKIDNGFNNNDGVKFRRCTGSVLRGCEVMNIGGAGIGAGTNGVSIGSCRDILIENCLIHHCLATNKKGERDDSHGIAVTTSFNTIVRGTEVHHVSGDAFQVGPDYREWNDVLIEDCLFWNGPLESDMAGYKAGQSPGENAIDTKTPGKSKGAPKYRITLRRITAYGWTAGMIDNQGAFNMKQRIIAVMDGCIAYGNEIGYRIRTPSKILMINCIAVNNTFGIRYEGEHDVKMLNCTIGGRKQKNLRIVDTNSKPVVANCLILAGGGSVPGKNNAAVSESGVVNWEAGDYRPRQGSPAVNACPTLPAVDHDLTGAPRVPGGRTDAGALLSTSKPYVFRPPFAPPEPKTKPSGNSDEPLTMNLATSGYRDIINEIRSKKPPPPTDAQRADAVKNLVQRARQKIVDFCQSEDKPTMTMELYGRVTDVIVTDSDIDDGLEIEIDGDDDFREWDDISNAQLTAMLISLNAQLGDAPTTALIGLLHYAAGNEAAAAEYINRAILADETQKSTILSALILLRPAR